MAVVLPILRTAFLLANIWHTFKILKYPPVSRRSDRPSVRAMAARKREMKACLSVWVVWACLSSVEKLVDNSIGIFVPFYGDLKILFLVIFFFSRAIIAEPLLLHILRPLLRPYIATIDYTLDIFGILGAFVIYLMALPWVYFRNIFWSSTAETASPASPYLPRPPIEPVNRIASSSSELPDVLVADPGLPRNHSRVSSSARVVPGPISTTTATVSEAGVTTRRRKQTLDTSAEVEQTQLKRLSRRPDPVPPPVEPSENPMYPPIGASSRSKIIAVPSSIPTGNDSEETTRVPSKQAAQTSYYAIRNRPTPPSGITLRLPVVQGTRPGVLNAAEKGAALPGAPSTSRSPIDREMEPPIRVTYPPIPPSPYLPGSYIPSPNSSRPSSIYGGDSQPNNPIHEPAERVDVQNSNVLQISIPKPSSHSIHKAPSITSVSSSTSMEASSSQISSTGPSRRATVAERKARLLDSATEHKAMPSATARGKRKAVPVSSDDAPKPDVSSRTRQSGTIRRNTTSTVPSGRVTRSIAGASRDSESSSGSISLKRPISAATLARRQRLASSSAIQRPSSKVRGNLVETSNSIRPSPQAATLNPGQKRSVKGQTKAPAIVVEVDEPEEESSDSTSTSAKKKRKVDDDTLHTFEEEEDVEDIPVSMDNSLRTPRLLSPTTQASDNDSSFGFGFDELNTPVKPARRILLRYPPSLIPPAPMPAITAVGKDEQDLTIQVHTGEPEEEEPLEPRRRGIRFDDDVPAIIATRPTRNISVAAAGLRRKATISSASASAPLPQRAGRKGTKEDV